MAISLSIIGIRNLTTKWLSLSTLCNLFTLSLLCEFRVCLFIELVERSINRFSVFAGFNRCTLYTCNTGLKAKYLNEVKLIIIIIVQCACVLEANTTFRQCQMNSNGTRKRCKTNEQKTRRPWWCDDGNKCRTQNDWFDWNNSGADKPWRQTYRRIDAPQRNIVWFMLDWCVFIKFI